MRGMIKIQDYDTRLIFTTCEGSSVELIANTEYRTTGMGLMIY